jgi:hypothetical protein
MSAGDSDILSIEKDILGQMGETGDDEKDTKAPKPDDLESDDDSSDDDEDESEDGDSSEEETDDEDAVEGGDEDENQELSRKVRPDKKGNLVDPKTGKIVATAGAARRFYEDLVNSKKQVSALQNEVRRRDGLMSQAREAIISLNAKVEAVDKLNNLPKQLGLTPQDQAEFMAIAAQFKDNHKALDAIRYLLTKAAQRGIDIKSLGVGSNGFDPSVIVNDLTRKIETSLKPIQDRFTQSEQQEQQLNQIRNEVATFTNANPESQQYLPVLGKILENPQFSHLGLDGAWLMLQNYLLRKNMRGQSRRPAGVDSARPSGRSRPGVQSSGVGAIDDSPVSVEQSFRDIVKGVIADYGDPE